MYSLSRLNANREVCLIKAMTYKICPIRNAANPNKNLLGNISKMSPSQPKNKPAAMSFWKTLFNPVEIQR